MKAQNRNLGILARLIQLGYVLIAYSLLTGCNQTGSLKEMMVLAKTKRGDSFYSAQARTLSQGPQSAEAESNTTPSAQWEAGLVAVQNTLQKQERELAELDRRVNLAEAELAIVERRIDWTMQRKAEIELEIARLQGMIRRKGIEIAAVQERIAVAAGAMFPKTALKMVSEASEAVRKAETVYFISSSAKELKACGVLEDENVIIGDLGFGRKLSGDMSPEDFVPANIYKDHTIPVSGRKPKLATAHPRASYKWLSDDDGNITHLRILDPELFWRNSKYLVIVVA